MIIYHSSNIAGKVRAQTFMVKGSQPFLHFFISESAAAPPVTITSLYRQAFRGVFSRIFGRMN